MSEIVQVIGKALMEYKDKPGLPREWGLGHAEARAKFYISALESAGYVIVKREPDEAMLIAGYDARNAARGSAVSGMTIDAQLRAQCFREDAIWHAMIAAQEQKP